MKLKGFAVAALIGVAIACSGTSGDNEMYVRSKSHERGFYKMCFKDASGIDKGCRGVDEAVYRRYEVGDRYGT